MIPPVETTVAGFRVRSLIGESDMALVYLAEEVATGRQVALGIGAAAFACAPLPALISGAPTVGLDSSDAPIAGGTEPSAIDTHATPVDDGFYYMVRAVSACAKGTFGSGSRGESRTPVNFLACP